MPTFCAIPTDSCAVGLLHEGSSVSLTIPVSIAIHESYTATGRLQKQSGCRHPSKSLRHRFHKVLSHGLESCMQCIQTSIISLYINLPCHADAMRKPGWGRRSIGLAGMLLPECHRHHLLLQAGQCSVSNAPLQQQGTLRFCSASKCVLLTF